MITWGIWPGVVDRDLVTLETPIAAPPEDTGATLAALRELAGPADRFYVRCYRSYGEGGALTMPPTPRDPRPYLGEGRVIDLVAGYASDRADPDGFARAVRAAVREVAELGGGKLQVCEELNVPLPLDGGRPGCFEAFAAGLAAAFDERRALGEPDVLIGFNAAVPDQTFWENVAAAVDPATIARVDFVGLDFFPDVFRPIPAESLRPAVRHVLRAFREGATAIGVPASVPIHITETGWPTGPEHSEEDQARVIGAVAAAVLGVAGEVGVAAYELFGLRDGLTGGPRTNRFGLLRDDHSAKPAFEVVRALAAGHAKVDQETQK